MKEFPTVVSSRDGHIQIEVLGFLGSEGLTDQSAVGFYFHVRVEPHGEPIRVAVIFSKMVMALGLQGLNLPKEVDHTLTFSSLSLARIGDHIESEGFSSQVDGGERTTRIQCFTQTFEEWRESRTANDREVDSYLQSHILATWKYGHKQWTIGTPDCVRRGLDLNGIDRVIALGEGEDWEVIKRSEQEITLAPLVKALRKTRDQQLASSTGTAQPDAMGQTPEGMITVQDSARVSKTADQTTNPQTVFVVHGRDEELRKSLFSFLRALGLQPMEWSQALVHTGKATPYIGEVLDSAFSQAQAVLVMLSPDDEVRLSEQLWAADEPAIECTVQGQSRPNVLFEAGMAFGTHADRTLLVQIGDIKSFSDVAGRHVLRLDNSPEKRNDLAQRLKQAGCSVDTRGRDWVSSGDFTCTVQARPDWAKRASLETTKKPLPNLDVRMDYLGSWSHEQIVVHNVGDGVAYCITIVTDGLPIDEQSYWVSQTLPDKLRPDEKFGVKIALAMGSPERADVSVSWRDEYDQEYHTKRLLQFI